MFYCRDNAEINGWGSLQTSSWFDSNLLRNRQQKHTAVRYQQGEPPPAKELQIFQCKVLHKFATHLLSANKIKNKKTMKMDYLTYSKRLEYLLESIEKGWINTPKQICEKFNCSDKTARNMINRLREMGHCIEYCKVLRKYHLKIK